MFVLQRIRIIMIISPGWRFGGRRCLRILTRVFGGMVRGRLMFRVRLRGRLVGRFVFAAGAGILRRRFCRTRLRLWGRLLCLLRRGLLRR